MKTLYEEIPVSTKELPPAGYYVPVMVNKVYDTAIYDRIYEIWVNINGDKINPTAWLKKCKESHILQQHPTPAQEMVSAEDCLREVFNNWTEKVCSDEQWQEYLEKDSIQLTLKAMQEFHIRHISQLINCIDLQATNEDKERRELTLCLYSLTRSLEKAEKTPGQQKWYDNAIYTLKKHFKITDVLR